MSSRTGQKHVDEFDPPLLAQNLVHGIDPGYVTASDVKSRFSGPLELGTVAAFFWSLFRHLKLAGNTIAEVTFEGLHFDSLFLIALPPQHLAPVLIGTVAMLQ